jgi:hypothetical protein
MKFMLKQKRNRLFSKLKLYFKNDEDKKSNPSQINALTTTAAQEKEMNNL